MLDYLLMKFDPETYFDSYNEPEMIATIAPKPVTPEAPEPPLLDAIEKIPEAEVVIPDDSQKKKILEMFPGSVEVEVIGGGKEQTPPTKSIIHDDRGLQKPSGLIRSG